MDIIAKYNIEEKSLSETNSPSSRFRIFSLGKGFTLYVGKNAKSNDELTMKFAKPNDLWFHARGAEGSHSVLKCDKIGNIPKEIIEKSAQITAYYSKARNSKYTPVCYTYRKYVHKPKGANPGTVTITREEVIMVEPKLND
jgi:predicted ribosome quality control (RQC) complex YloA/Tae2 family protein